MEKITIESSSFDDLFQELSEKYNCTKNQNELIVENNNSTLTVKKCTTDPDIEIATFQGIIDDDLRLIKQKSEEDIFITVFFLSSFSFTSDNIDNKYHFREKQYFSNFKGNETFYLQKDSEVSLVVIKYNQNFVKRLEMESYNVYYNFLQQKNSFDYYDTISNESLIILEDVLKRDFNQAFERLRINACLYHLLYNFTIKAHAKLTTSRIDGKSLGIDYGKIFLVKSYIDEHFDQNITPEKLSQIAGFSYSKLRKLFKEALGISILQYINDTKLEKANEWLEQGMYNVSECTFVLGFISISHFGKLFKRKYGILPSQIKRSA